MEDSRNIKLTNYQRKFVDSFFSLAGKRDHLLLAPAGSGKSFLTALIVERLISNGAQRILVLTSAKALVDQYKYIFDEYVKSSQLLVLSRKTLREYETLKMQGYELTPTIVIGTWENAKLEDAGELIFSTTWNLIIIDEAHFLPGSQRANLLCSVIARANSEYKLFLSRPIDNNNIKQILGEKYKAFEVTRWSRGELIALGESSRPIEIRTVNYERTPEEIAFIQNYVKLSKLLSNSNVEQKVRSRLVSSSLYAAEDSLRNFRNRLMHGDLDLLSPEGNSSEEISSIENIKDEELLGDLNVVQADTNLPRPNHSKITELVTSAINSLDLVQVDSKFNALLTYLKKYQAQASRVWIYASYKSTISYLYSSLKESFQKVYFLHGQMPSSDVQGELQKFEIDGGILIASSNLLRGINLNLDSLVLYDVPESENLIYFVLSRAILPANSSSSMKPIDVAIVSDTSAVLRSEKTREDRLVKISESIIGEEKNV